MHKWDLTHPSGVDQAVGLATEYETVSQSICTPRCTNRNRLLQSKALMNREQTSYWIKIIRLVTPKTEQPGTEQPRFHNRSTVVCYERGQAGHTKRFRGGEVMVLVVQMGVSPSIMGHLHPQLVVRHLRQQMPRHLQHQTLEPLYRKIGDSVWRFSPPKARLKFGKPWEGPYMITAKVNALCYRIQKSSTSRSISCRPP